MTSEWSFKRCIAFMAASCGFILMVTMIAFVTGVTKYEGFMVETNGTHVDALGTAVKSMVSFGPHRKLLLLHDAMAPAPAQAKFELNRIWGDKCSNADIVINQGPTSPLPNGIPTYTVEIMNVCTTGCDISAIHLSCGWFSSARLINPRLFKRLSYNDCLVNDGKPLVNGNTLSFQYANSFAYPLSISSVVC